MMKPKQSKHSKPAPPPLALEYEKLFEIAQTGLMFITGDRIMIKANQKLADMFGYASPEDMVGISMRELHDNEESYNSFGKQHYTAIAKHKKLNIEHLITRDDGTQLWVSISGRALDDAYPADLSKGVLWSFQDISMQKESEQQLRIERDRAQHYLDIAGSIIIALDINGDISLINRAGCKLLEASEDEIIGKNWFENFLLVDNIAAVKKIFHQLIAKNIENTTFVENKIRTAKGNIRDIAWHNSYTLSPSGEVTGLLSSGEDITERNLYESYLKQQSITDELTGLHNRKEYTNRITELLEEFKRYNMTFSLLIIDIDHFKSVNDSYGHAKGDEILVKISDIFRCMTRSNDYAFRIGGEEFAILVTNTNKESAITMAQKIRTNIEHTHLLKERRVTISIGVAEVIEVDTIDSLFKRADDNLYYAKQHGRNQVIAHI